MKLVVPSCCNHLVLTRVLETNYCCIKFFNQLDNVDIQFDLNEVKVGKSVAVAFLSLLHDV